MRKKEEENVIEIKEDTQINEEIILEKGDRIRVLTEAIGDNQYKSLLYIQKEVERQGIETELVPVLNGKQYILKVYPKSGVNLTGYLDFEFHFGLTGNGLVYRENRNGEVWVYPWDLKLDQKWGAIWK